VCRVTSAQRVLKADGKRGHVVYNVECNSVGYNWRVQRRYTEFSELHKKLLHEYGNVMKTLALPKFPPQTLLAPSPLEILRRQAAFEAFLHKLLSVPTLASTVHLLTFLGMVRVKEGHIEEKNNAPKHGGREAMTVDAMLDALDIGDVVLFRSATIIGTVQRAVMGSSYDHVGLVIRVPIHSKKRHSLALFEARSAGILVTPLESTLNSVLKNKAEVAIRRLEWDLRDMSNEMPSLDRHKEYQAAIQRLADFVERATGKGYSLKSLMSGHLSGKEHDGGYFCSQLVAKAYKTMGLLTSTRKTWVFLPGTFTGALNLLGARLGPETRVTLADHDRIESPSRKLYTPSNRARSLDFEPSCSLRLPRPLSPASAPDAGVDATAGAAGGARGGVGPSPRRGSVSVSTQRRGSMSKGLSLLGLDADDEDTVNMSFSRTTTRTLFRRSSALSTHSAASDVEVHSPSESIRSRRGGGGGVGEARHRRLRSESKGRARRKRGSTSKRGSFKLAAMLGVDHKEMVGMLKSSSPKHSPAAAAAADPAPRLSLPLSPPAAARPTGASLFAIANKSLRGTSAVDATPSTTTDAKSSAAAATRSVDSEWDTTTLSSARHHRGSSASDGVILSDTRSPRSASPRRASLASPRSMPPTPRSPQTPPPLPPGLKCLDVWSVAAAATDSPTMSPTTAAVRPTRSRRGGVVTDSPELILPRQVVRLTSDNVTISGSPEFNNSSLLRAVDSSKPYES